MLNMQRKRGSSDGVASMRNHDYNPRAAIVKTSDCAREVGRLFSGYPSNKAGELTATTYVDDLATLPYADALRDAVTSLLRSERWLPTIAQVREEYGRFHDRYLPKALPMQAQVSEEDRQRNMERLKALTAHLARHDGAFSDCQDSDCAAAREGIEYPKGEDLAKASST